MLERLDSVKKVGLFDDYTHSPDCDLGEITLIFGENGVGKSTIAAILDSLREGNASEVIRRRTLPGDIAPTAVVTVHGKVYTFDGRSWDDRPPDDTIDVFFPGFVSRNVHAVNSVESEHRRHLCEIVLGRKAVESVARLAVVDGEARAALAEKKKVEEALDLLIKKPDTLETFLGLPRDEDIDGHLDEARAELKQAQSKEAILARITPQPVILPTIDRGAITGFLEKCSDGIGAESAAVVQEHVREHLDSGGENWLEYGAKHIDASEKCPFCAQDITGSNLVDAIRSYFSAEYAAYTEALSAAIQKTWERLGPDIFARVRMAVASQVAVALQWVNEASIDRSAVDALITEAEVAWNSGVGKLKELIASKQTRPLVMMDPALANDALTEYERATRALGEVNSVLSARQKKAEALKEALRKVDVSEIEERVHHLENQKARYEPLAQKHINTRNDLIKKRLGLDAEKKNLKNAIDGHAAAVVGKYQDGINHYLEYFGCDVRIESVEPKYPGGKASVQYKLRAHGHEIQLGVSEDCPCFETVLSEGDKNILALSFFFARLKDRNLTGRVVVLDDPVNSLGSSRRTLIESVVRDLRSRGAQLVVLTHDERLAALIWRDTGLKAVDFVSLQVERTANGSRLKCWDVERATQSEYVKNFLSLEGYLENGGDHAAVAGCIRPYVEQRLRHLYPGRLFSTRDTLGVMIGKIRKCPPGSRLEGLQSKLPDLGAINDASLPSHHATDDVPGMTPLTSDGVRLFATKALAVLG